MAGQDADDETVDQLAERILEETEAKEKSSVRTELEERQLKSEQEAKYNNCTREFPSDFCADWYLTE